MNYLLGLNSSSVSFNPSLVKNAWNTQYDLLDIDKNNNNYQNQKGLINMNMKIGEINYVKTEFCQKRQKSLPRLFKG